MAKTLGVTKIYKTGATLFLEAVGEPFKIPVNYPDFYPEAEGIIVYDALGTQLATKFFIAYADVRDSSNAALSPQDAPTTMDHIATEMAK